jgi:rubrerythrin
LKNNYATRVLKYHNLRKFISQMDSIEFSNPDSAKKKRSTLNNFKEINNLMDEIGPNGSWSEVICSFCSTKTTGKNIYMVCPHCSKKVLDEVQGQCPNCSKDYESAIPKYTMSFSLCDSFDSVWASAFDRPSEKILGIPASKYTKLS